MPKEGKYTLALQVEYEETKNRGRIIKTEVLDRFNTEREALAELKALLKDILEDDEADDDEET